MYKDAKKYTMDSFAAETLEQKGRMTDEHVALRIISYNVDCGGYEIIDIGEFEIKEGLNRAFIKSKPGIAAFVRRFIEPNLQHLIDFELVKGR